MLKFKRCNLRGASPRKLVSLKGKASEMGGYFIVNGLERYIRPIIMPKRNYPMSTVRSSFSEKREGYADKAVVIRCVRADQTSLTVKLYCLRNGSARLGFWIQGREYMLPVEENCIGKKITKCIVADDSKVIDGVSHSEFEASVIGKTIVAARRKGKNMWLQLDSPPFPFFQFGMASAIYIRGVAVINYKRSAVNDEDEWPSKYSKFFIQLDDGLEISFTDKRRFAKVRLLKDPTSVPPISELGPDALFEPMTLDEFTGRLHKKKTEIKVLLLDQSYISGIGNWVADEVLYQARIHPQQSASSLSGENCSTLYECSKEVIEKAVEVETRNQVQHQPTPMATETHQWQNLQNQTEENSINIQQKTQLISNRKLTSDNPNATTTSLQQLFSRSPLNTPQAAATQHRMPAVSMSATTLNRAPSHLQNQQYRAE
ncbi:formamidopyrimidine-DNA glycosylase [Lathyrus oleraceus]|uniref:formamidopyrimidine-DNA glycosylase n=1 Tax=Pisum sativum TaxID=3888 RepID=UPI0021CFBF95|nr:formamidopyrimidine-DNA glycosylase-like [Pisum sativum]